MSEVELLSIADRPMFARKLLAVWRLHHLAAGEDIAIMVYPDEWPADHPLEVKGVPVRIDAKATTAPGAMLILGRARDSWRWAFNIADIHAADFTVENLAIITAYGEVTNDGEIKLWLSPSPETGEVPMWTLGKSAA